MNNAAQESRLRTVNAEPEPYTNLILQLELRR
jgi:hypothetical protein